MCLGAVHHDDLLYLFYVPLMIPEMFKESDPENVIVERLTGLWANFATNGFAIKIFSLKLCLNSKN